MLQLSLLFPHYSFYVDFLIRSTLHLPKSFSTESAVPGFFGTSASEPSNVFIVDHHRSVLPWLLLPACGLWKSQICQSLTVQQGAAFCVPHCFSGSSQEGHQAHLSFRGTSKIQTWLFLNLNYLLFLNLSYLYSYAVAFAALAELGRPQSDKRLLSPSLGSRAGEGYICEQSPVCSELNLFISVGKRQLSKSGIGVAGQNAAGLAPESLFH